MEGESTGYHFVGENIRGHKFAVARDSAQYTAKWYIFHNAGHQHKRVINVARDNK